MRYVKIQIIFSISSKSELQAFKPEQNLDQTDIVSSLQQTFIRNVCTNCSRCMMCVLTAVDV